jgi:hypothetical protein
MGWVVNATPPPLYPRERPGTLCTGGWVAPGQVWTDAENLAPNVIPSRTVQPVASRHTHYAIPAHW